MGQWALAPPPPPPPPPVDWDGGTAGLWDLLCRPQCPFQGEGPPLALSGFLSLLSLSGPILSILSADRWDDVERDGTASHPGPMPCRSCCPAAGGCAVGVPDPSPPPSPPPLAFLAIFRVSGRSVDPICMGAAAVVGKPLWQLGTGRGPSLFRVV